jgi:hypothetical protein
MSDPFLGNGSPTAEFVRKAFGDYVPGSDEVAKLNLDDWGVDKFMDPPEPVEWLIEDVLPIESVGLIAGMGGLGKSYLLMDLCVRLAAGPGIGQSCLGGKVMTEARTFLLTGEDNYRAVNRRLHQIIDPREFKKLGDRLRLVPMPDAGGTQHFLINVGGTFHMTTEFEDICSEIIRFDPDLGGIDPFSAFCAADINSDPAAAQTWWNAMTKLSSETKSALITSHHMRKSEAEITDLMSARLAIRGTSGIVDGARWVYAIYPAPVVDRLAAEAALDLSLGPLDLVYGGVVKANEFGMGEVTTYVRCPSSGLLLDATSDLGQAITEKNTLGEQQLEETVAEINVRWDAGEPFSLAPQSDRWIGSWMMGRFDVKKPVVRKYLGEWKDKGYFKQVYVTKLKSKGLRGN